MEKTLIRGACSRIGLTGRLSIAIAGAMLISAVVLLFTSVMHEKTHFTMELGAQLTDDMDMLLIILPEQAVIGDYATIEKMLHNTVKTVNIERIIYTDSYGKSISAIDKPVVSIAPQWFTWLLAMPAFSKKEAIVIGNRTYGSVELYLTATPSANYLWSMFAGDVQALLLALALVVSAITLIVRYSLRPLFALADGARRIGSGDYSARLPEQGTPDMIVTISAFNQMGEQLKQAIDQLNLSKDRFRALYNETPIMLHSIDSTGTLVEVNDFWLKTMGYERSEVIGRRVVDFYTEESRKYALNVTQPSFFRDGIAKDISYQFVKKNGELVDVLLSATGERDAGGNVVHSLAVIEDITERRRSEEALKKSEERYKAIVENQSEFVVRYLPGGILTFINDTFCTYLNMTRDELLGRSYYPFMHADDRESFIRDIEALNMHKPTMVAEAKVVLPNGRVTWHKWAHSAIFDKGGNIIEYQATGRDITDSKRMEEALRRSEENLQRIMDSSSAVIFAKDLDGKYLFINTLYEKLFHVSKIGMIGKTDYDIFPRDAADAFRAADQQALKAGMPIEVEEAVPHDDGMHYYISLKFPLCDDNKKPYAVCGIATDITGRKKLEEQSLKVQKLEAIGTLAGGIAHDFNNLLQGVFGYISLAKLKSDDRGKSLAALEEAEKALHLSVQLTNQLLTFSKGGKPVKKTFGLRPVIENAAKFALSGSRSDCRVAVDDGLWQVEADEGQIGQVIQNIVLNADQAMPEGGQVEIRARNVQPPDKGLPQGLQQGVSYVEIAVKDSGVGIPEHYATRIFEPYFTTKEKGSGLGLATSYSIVKNHNGLIEIKSELGKGTTFFIYIPAVAAIKTETQIKPAVTKAGRAGRVLVMDDEQVVRDVAGELIRELGHRVEFAEHGKEAIEKYKAAKRSREAFDVVILDLTIRDGMGGAETVRHLTEIDPGVKAVVSSGYSDDAATSNYREQGFTAFLKKPYTIHELREVLNRLLD